MPSVRSQLKQSAKLIREDNERLEFQREQINAKIDANNLALAQVEAEPRELTKCDVIVETVTVQKWCDVGYCEECSHTVAGSRMKETWRFCPYCGSVATFKYENDSDAENRRIREAIAHI